MDVEIVSKKDNPLLERTDVSFRITHPKEKTPQRSAVRDRLAAELGGKKEGIIITRMRSRFGRSVTEGTAKAYKSADAAKNTEVPHLLKRHGLSGEKKEAPKAEEEAPPPPPPKSGAEKPAKAEKKDETPAKTETKAETPVKAEKKEG
jgi:small subunit ribosomal protein S24e